MVRAVPKTPPSYSAIASNEERPSYLQQLKIAFTTVPFIILLFSLGSGIALVTSLATVTQQILCPLGYSEV
ncbi:UNVERIFIED_CONTAM: hypothetical protein GTU68_006617 [Idotea baltica]|nr:hypothetical protein [Idotea baltica]